MYLYCLTQDVIATSVAETSRRAIKTVEFADRSAITTSVAALYDGTFFGGS
jgi:hypothetical protein